MRLKTLHEWGHLGSNTHSYVAVVVVVLQVIAVRRRSCWQRKRQRGRGKHTAPHHTWAIQTAGRGKLSHQHSSLNLN